VTVFDLAVRQAVYLGWICDDQAHVAALRFRHWRGVLG
jgi:hypothetical protein